MVNALVIVVVVLLLLALAVATPIGVGLLCVPVWQRLLSMMTSPATDNRIFYWPIVLAIVWPLLLALLWLFFEMSAVLSFISENFSIITIVSLWFVLIAGPAVVAMWVGSVAIACNQVGACAALAHGTLDCHIAVDLFASPV